MNPFAVDKDWSLNLLRNSQENRIKVLSLMILRDYKKYRLDVDQLKDNSELLEMLRERKYFRSKLDLCDSKLVDDGLTIFTHDNEGVVRFCKLFKYNEAFKCWMNEPNVFQFQKLVLDFTDIKLTS